MKNIYYTIEKETTDFVGIEECSGNRTVTTYTVENGDIKEWFSLDTVSTDNTKDEIDEYLIDNGYGDDEYEMIQL